MQPKILFTTIAIVTSFMAYGQKLPNTQGAGLQSPAHLKIDGKALDWDNHYAAYNNATQVFYSIANNDVNLYLIVHAVDPLVIRKIAAGGISLTISPTEKLNDKQNVSVTYPAFSKKNLPNLNLKSKPAIVASTANHANQLALFAQIVNNKFIDSAKEIKVTGMKDVDTLISIYNSEGIKAAARFDDKLTYTYELSIPIKYLGAVANQTIFHYNLRLNGSNIAEGAIIEEIEGGTRVRFTGTNPPTTSEMQFIGSPTDLWATYNYVKK